MAFGGTANFVGSVNGDDLGAAFRDDIAAAGVGFDYMPTRWIADHIINCFGNA